MPVPGPVDLPVTVPKGRITPELVQETQTTLRDLIPKDRKGALLALADKEGTSIVVAHKIRGSDNWIIGVDAMTTWDGKTSGRIRLLGTW